MTLPLPTKSKKCKHWFGLNCGNLGQVAAGFQVGIGGAMTGVALNNGLRLDRQC